MSSLIIRLRRLVGELSYAQRRTLELQTGLSFSARPHEHSRRGRRDVAELDALWAQARVDEELQLSPNLR